MSVIDEFKEILPRCVHCEVAVYVIDSKHTGELDVIHTNGFFGCGRDGTTATLASATKFNSTAIEEAS